MLAFSKIPAAAAGLFIGLLVISSTSAEASIIQSDSAAINKAALSAYCEEAEKNGPQLRDEQVSYKKVARLASARAMKEHPDVYRDPNAWLARIVDMLDKYGDEPAPELCHEEPHSQSPKTPDPRD